ncbi:MAG: XRE family transcriptional regulator [Spirochaetes bacterium]|nr:XRE family transcriptional regulator [Spirochaetota bacterium]
MGSYSSYDIPDTDNSEVFQRFTEYYTNNVLSSTASLSDKLKQFRMQNNLTLEQLAAITGISGELLQRIEDRHVYPSLKIIHQLTRSLQKAKALVAGSPVEWGYTVIKKDEIITSKNERPKAQHNSVEAGLQRGETASEAVAVKAYIITLEGNYTKKDFSIHNGEEFIHVKKGAIKITLGANEVILQQGDSIYFLSLIPHKIENIASHESIIHVIVYQE